MLVLASTPIRKRNTGAGILPQVRVRTVNLLVKYSDTLPVELPVDFLFSGKPAPASTQNESVKIYNRNACCSLRTRFFCATPIPGVFACLASSAANVKHADRTRCSGPPPPESNPKFERSGKPCLPNAHYAPVDHI